MVSVLVLVVALGALWTLTRPRLYAATAEVLLVQSGTPVNGANMLPALQELQGLTKRPVKAQVRILQSRSLQAHALATLAPPQRASAQQAQVTVEGDRDTDIISVTVTSEYPEVAADYANSLILAYKARDLAQYRAATRSAATYVQGELHRVGNELRMARRRLARFKHATGVYVPDEAMRLGVNNTAALDAQRHATNTELAQARQSLTSLTAALRKAQPEIIASVTEVTNPIKLDIERQLAQLEAQRAELLQTYTVQAPEVTAIDAQIAEARTRLTGYATDRVSNRVRTTNPLHATLVEQFVAAQVQVTVLQARLQIIERQLAANQSKMQELAAYEVEAIELQSTVQQLDGAYKLLSDNYQTLRISEEARLASVQIVNDALPSQTPVSPNIPRSAVMILLLGLAGAIGVAALREAFDDRIHAAETLERLSTRPILGQIPLVRDGEPQLLHPPYAHNLLLESVRLLRGNLLFADVDQDIRVLAITSAGSSEGKSTTSINLAAVMAMSGKRVVLVDGDLRRPSLHTYFGVSNAAGVTSVVTGALPIAQAIQQTSMEGVALLTTGPLPPNPPDVLGSHGMRALIEKLTELYDVVIIDAPPAAGLSDVPILTTLVDGLLVVVSAEQTRRSQLLVALRALDDVHAPVLGYIFNKTAIERSAYAYANTYYYSSSTLSAVEVASASTARSRQGESLDE